MAAQNEELKWSYLNWLNNSNLAHIYYYFFEWNEWEGWKVVTERWSKASISLFLVAGNIFGVFVKTGDVFSISISNIVIGSGAFG